MKRHRLHRKVWLWWGCWWALQLYPGWYLSLGVHLDARRRYVDLHLGWFILALGERPEVTAAVDRYRQSCRGFFVEGVTEPIY